MGRTRLLFGLVLILAAVLVGSAPTTAVASGGCESLAQWESACASSDGSSVDVSIDYQGGGGSGGGGSGGGGGGYDAGGGGTSYVRESPCPEATPDERCVGAMTFGDPAPVNVDTGPPPLPAVIQVSDLANVTPAQAQLFMEPNGWAILGQPVNFWTTASAHSVDTTVLGHQVTVNFTPISTTYDYGDGYSQTLETPGSSWEAQGLPELSDTHTSHRYNSKDPVTVVATVNYAATVSAGGRTITVNGTVQSLTGTLAFDLYESDTYLSANP